jgi:hypothetical protein
MNYEQDLKKWRQAPVLPVFLRVLQGEKASDAFILKSGQAQHFFRPR